MTPHNADAVLLQLILAHATYALQSANVGNVRSAVIEHCSANEIAKAKQELWLRCSGDIFGADMPRRRDTSARTIEEAHLQDILTALQKLENANQLPNFVVEACDLGKISHL